MGPTFSADLRKSLFAHLVLQVLPFDVDDADVFDGDSLFGAGGGRDLVLGDFCFVNAIDGLCDFDLLVLVGVDAVFKATLLRDDADDDFDVTELSRDFDGLFSPFSGDSRKGVFDGETLLLLLLYRP